MLLYITNTLSYKNICRKLYILSLKIPYLSLFRVSLELQNNGRPLIRPTLTFLLILLNLLSSILIKVRFVPDNLRQNSKENRKKRIRREERSKLKKMIMLKKNLENSKKNRKEKGSSNGVSCHLKISSIVTIKTHLELLYLNFKIMKNHRYCRENLSSYLRTEF